MFVFYFIFNLASMYFCERWYFLGKMKYKAIRFQKNAWTRIKESLEVLQNSVFFIICSTLPNLKGSEHSIKIILWSVTLKMPSNSTMTTSIYQCNNNIILSRQSLSVTCLLRWSQEKWNGWFTASCFIVTQQLLASNFSLFSSKCSILFRVIATPVKNNFKQ